MPSVCRRVTSTHTSNRPNLLPHRVPTDPNPDTPHPRHTEAVHRLRACPIDARNGDHRHTHRAASLLRCSRLTYALDLDTGLGAPRPDLGREDEHTGVAPPECEDCCREARRIVLPSIIWTTTQPDVLHANSAQLLASLRAGTFPA